METGESLEAYRLASLAYAATNKKTLPQNEVEGKNQ